MSINKDKGKYVSRSTYQKVVEENRRLKKDIKILTTAEPTHDEWVEVYTKWERHFYEQQRLSNTVRALLLEMKNNISPNSLNPNT